VSISFPSVPNPRSIEPSAENCAATAWWPVIPTTTMRPSGRISTF